MESGDCISKQLEKYSTKLANRRSLFHILAFLDDKLPICASIHSMVKAALSTDQAYRVYFQRRSPSDESEDLNLILGVREEITSGPNEPVKRVWSITSWQRQETDLVNAIGCLEDIRWNQDSGWICSPNHEPSQELQTFFDTKKALMGLESNYQPMYQFYIPIKTALNIKLKTPDDVYVQSLERCHAQTVYDHWLYKRVSSAERLADKIEAFPSAGVFLKSSNELVSWMLVFPPFEMGCLETKENHRRKGYATLVTYYLAKLVAQAGFLPTVLINLKNKPSQEFFTKIGFQLLQPLNIYEWID